MSKIIKVHFKEFAPGIAGKVKSIGIDGVTYINLDFPEGKETKTIIVKDELKSVGHIGGADNA